MLEIHIEETENYTLCRPSGELDAYTVGAFREALSKLAGQRHLLIDLSEVPFMDSAGLGALIGLIRQWSEQADKPRGVEYSGLRTFTLWSVLGCVAAFLSTTYSPAVLPVVATASIEGLAEDLRNLARNPLSAAGLTALMPLLSLILKNLKK